MKQTTVFLCLFTCFTYSQIPENIPSDGLLAYYPFNGNANDASGNGHHGTVNGATLSIDRNGYDNTAYDFQVADWDSANNGGDYIYIPHSSEFNFESFSLSAWIYRKSAGASKSPQHLTIIRKFEEGYNSTNGESWQFDIEHGTNNGGSKLTATILEQSASPATQFDCATSQTIPDNEWTNVTMTYSDKTIKTFINGVESCSSTNNDITLNVLGTSGISIGMSVQANGNWGPFDGSIDEVGIWNRALSPIEIQSLFTSSNADILLNGTVSAENHQIKNVADPTDAQDAVTMSYVDSAIGNNSPTVEDVLTIGNDANGIQLKGLQDPTEAQDAATKAYIDALMANLQTPSNIPTDGLVAYYPFNGNANDESGNGNHGTATDATLTYDRFDNENSAYSFDGDGDYIVSTSNVGVGQTTLTFSFWAKTEYGSKPMAALSQDCGKDCDNAFGLVLNKFLNSAVVCDDGHMGTSPQSFGYAQPSHYATVRTTTANIGWNNYVLIVGADGDYSFNNFRFYVNGIEQITNCDHNWGNSEWQFNFPDYRLMIGNKPNSIEGYFHGEIDDVAIWNRALTIEEINTTFGATETENNIQNIEQVLTQGNDANGIQLKGIADPTEAQDAATKNYTYSKAEVDALLANLQSQIDNLDSTTVTDQDGNTYDYLTYGNQVWTVENAEMVTYRDGTDIPQVTDNTEWESLTTGAWSYYDNDPTKPRLYNWYAVMGIHDTDPNTPDKEFAPEGWHAPSDAEWTTLENHLIANGYNYDGTTTENKIAKAMASTTGWNTSTETGAVGNNQSTNNSSGFNAFPEGYRSYDSSFKIEGGLSIFWSSTETNTDKVWFRSLYYIDSSRYRSYNTKQYGYSVRFVRD